jgi:hypothetical protein
MRASLILASALCVAGCVGQSGGQVRLAAGEEDHRCTATVDGRQVAFNTDGRDFSQLRGRAVTIAASANLPSRCVGLLIAALQRAGTGPITYEGGAGPQLAMAGEDSVRPTARRAGSYGDERPSFENRSRRSEWQGSTTSNYPSAKSGRQKRSTKARSAGR